MGLRQGAAFKQEAEQREVRAQGGGVRQEAAFEQQAERERVLPQRLWVAD